jgi:hypothetical protein
MRAPHLLFILFFLTACGVQDSRIQIQENPTVETMLARRASEFVDIGTESEEILENLRKVVIYDDVLEFIFQRVDKNNVRCRKLDFETFQFFEDIWTKNNMRINLMYLVKNDSVQYGIISSIDSSGVKIVNEEEFKRNTHFIEAYIQNHERIYGIRKTMEEFIKEVVDTKYQIRIACGLSCSFYGEKEKMLFKEVQNQNTAHVLTLLTSMIPEEQALGIIGIKKLSEAGIYLDEEILKIVDHILKKNTTVFACMTCQSDFYKLDRYLKFYDWSKIPNIEL